MAGELCIRLLGTPTQLHVEHAGRAKMRTSFSTNGSLLEHPVVSLLAILSSQLTWHCYIKLLLNEF